MKNKEKNWNIALQKKKRIVFAQQKQSVPMSIHDFEEMTIFLCLICFPIYAKVQGFLDKHVLLCLHFTQKFKMAAKNGGKTSFGKKCQITVYTLRAKIFAEIALSRTVFEILKIFNFQH